MSLHRYLYAYSNPTVYIDLFGYASNREIWGLDEKSFEAAAAKDNSWQAAAKYAAKSTLYKTWNFLTGGFVERQDERQEKLDRGQISESDFWKGTTIDGTVSIASQFVGGAVARKVSGRVVTATGSKLLGSSTAGSAMAATTSALEQQGQVMTYEATDGRLGQEYIKFDEIGESAIVGGAFGAVVHGAGVGVSKLKEAYKPGKLQESYLWRKLADETGNIEALTTKVKEGQNLVPTTLNPNEINFSQRTVSENVKKYTQDMISGNWIWNESNTIRVMQREGQWVSYDNRRLMAAQNAGLKEIPVEVVDPKSIMPNSKMNSTWEEEFQSRFNHKWNIQAGGPVPNTGLRSQPEIFIRSKR